MSDLSPRQRAKLVRARGSLVLVARDWCEEPGARELAKRIESWWAAQGHQVHCDVVVAVARRAYNDRNTQKVMGIVSDLVDGLPPGYNRITTGL